MSNIKTELQYRIALGILGQMCSAGLVNDLSLIHISEPTRPY